MRRTLVILAGSAGPAVPALTNLQSNAHASEYRDHVYRQYVPVYEDRDDADHDRDQQTRHARKRLR
jgi:hypothetical protein